MSAYLVSTTPGHLALTALWALVFVATLLFSKRWLSPKLLPAHVRRNQPRR